MQQKTALTFQQWWKGVKTTYQNFDDVYFLRQFRHLIRFNLQAGLRTQVILFFVTLFLSPITLTGALLGYIRGYAKFMRPYQETPRLHALPKIVIFAMTAGAILIWVVLLLILKLLVTIIGPEVLEFKYLVLFFTINLLFTIPVFVFFRRWRRSNTALIEKMESHASARIAGPEIVEKYTGNNGFYIGGGMTYSEKGHLIAVAAARSGKGENIIIQNLMGLGGYEGSYVVTDVKGELFAITAAHLRRIGKKVVELNPWQLFKEKSHGNNTYNPFDLLSDKTSPHMIDDIQLLAELIVPIKHGDKNEFFTSSARNIVSTLLLNIALTQEGKSRSLATLWEWCRFSGAAWDEMLTDMSQNRDPVNGKALRTAASEIVNIMASPETFASIMANVYDNTNFLKSSALQDNLVSGLDPYSLTDGNTVVFIVIPADKLVSHANWLRLVVTTLMRSVVRKPNPNTRTTFLCDEAAALGYISEFPLCLSSYAGYGISLFPIYQDLNQIAECYGQNWQTVMANTSVKIMFGVRDNFTAEYISDAAGDTTFVYHRKDWMGNVCDIESHHRKLFTADEVKRTSKDEMFVFIGEHPVCVVPKQPYYLMDELKNEDGSNKYDPNPYIKDSL